MLRAVGMLKPFKISGAEHGKRSIAERLFKGEAYRLTGYGIGLGN
jgi:hypothetical protein